MKRELKHLLQVGHIPYYSGGDTEVNTRDGRRTRVKLSVDQLGVGLNNQYVTARVDYHIMEIASNYTHLRYLNIVRIPVPRNWWNKEIKIGDNARELKIDFLVFGKEHGWIEIPINDDDTVVEDAAVKIDGPGNNDDDNSGLELLFSIPVEVK